MISLGRQSMSACKSCECSGSHKCRVRCNRDYFAQIREPRADPYCAHELCEYERKIRGNGLDAYESWVRPWTIDHLDLSRLTDISRLQQLYLTNSNIIDYPRGGVPVKRAA
jgi:hypothetical protein